LYSVNRTSSWVNGTVNVPGMTSIENSSFTSDPWYPGINGTTYTVIREDLGPQDINAITIQVGLNMVGSTRLELVYRLSLIVDNVEVATTMLRVITWTA
jgi:hypothetical protein